MPEGNILPYGVKFDANGNIVTPEVSVIRIANQAVPNNTATAISFDAELSDSDNIWDAAAPTRLTIQTPGIYQFTGLARWNSALPGSTLIYSYIRLSQASGAALATLAEDQRNSPSGGGVNAFVTLSATYRMIAGWYAELVMNQYSGVDRNAQLVKFGAVMIAP